MKNVQMNSSHCLVVVNVHVMAVYMIVCQIDNRLTLCNSRNTQCIRTLTSYSDAIGDDTNSSRKVLRPPSTTS